MTTKDVVNTMEKIRADVGVGSSVLTDLKVETEQSSELCLFTILPDAGTISRMDMLRKKKKKKRHE